MKIGLMLGGGGAKGAYQLGVLKALEQHQFITQINTIAGASIGALNGYFYLSSLDNEKVIKSWLYGMNNNPITVKNLKNHDNKTGLFSLEVLSEMKDLYLTEDLFKTSPIDLYVSTTKIVNPKLTGFIMKWKWENEIIHLNESKTPFEDAVSSSSVPIIFGANEVRESYYIDGGLTNNNPINVLIEQGCDLIFSCALSKYDYKQFKNEKVTIVNLSSVEVLPKTKLESYMVSLDFSESLFEQRIKYGYYVSIEMIKECINQEILKMENKKLIPYKLKEGFNLIDVPAYVNNNIKIMQTNYEKSEENKEINNGNN